ncbi:MULTISPECIES: hypothetical protein [unclassified Gemella]|nr:MULTISPECIES: hypothetical protein [unclassified Gemella]
MKIKNNEAIEQKLNLKNLEDLKLPPKLVKEIIKNIGWFNIK